MNASVLLMRLISHRVPEESHYTAETGETFPAALGSQECCFRNVCRIVASRAGFDDTTLSLLHLCDTSQ